MVTTPSSSVAVRVLRAYDKLCWIRQFLYRRTRRIYNCTNSSIKLSNQSLLYVADGELTLNSFRTANLLPTRATVSDLRSLIYEIFAERSCDVIIKTERNFNPHCQQGSLYKMVATAFKDLPLDILLETFKFLSVHEIARVAQTCRSLRDAAGERAVWVDKSSFLHPQFPSLTVSEFPCEELRQKVTREAVLHERWQQESRTLNRDKVIQVYPDVPSYPRRVNYLEFLPGGNYIVFVLSDGNIRIEYVAPEGIKNLLEGVPEDHRVLEFWYKDCFLCPSSEQGGHVLVEVADQNIDNIQLIIHEYHVELSNISITTIGRFALDPIRQTHRRTSMGTKHGRIYMVDPDGVLPQIYASFFSIPVKPDIMITTAPAETVFRLPKTEESALIRGCCAIAMITETRFMAVGPGLPVSIFDIPQDTQAYTGDTLGGSAPIPLAPIWTSPEILLPSLSIFQCSPVYYSLRDPKHSTIWISEGTSFYYCLEVSTEGTPVVKSYRRSNCAYSAYPATGCGRGMWCSVDDGIVKVSTLTMSDPPVFGFFEFELNPGWKLTADLSSFDDGTGRMLFLVSDDDRNFALVCDVVDTVETWARDSISLQGGKSKDETRDRKGGKSFKGLRLFIRRVGCF